jgi:hypothetical protein
MTSKRQPKSHRGERAKARRAKKTLVARDGSAREMTLAEIYRKYPNQWVLIENPRLTKALEVIEGTVVAHSKDVDDIYKKARTGKYSRVAYEFRGDIPANPAILF